MFEIKIFPKYVSINFKLICIYFFNILKRLAPSDNSLPVRMEEGVLELKVTRYGFG